MIEPATRQEEIRGITGASGALSPLQEGERLDQPTFHLRYEQAPWDLRAELVGGIVHIMPSPVSQDHAGPFTLVQRWLGVFEEASPGTQARADATIILGFQSEPRPDAYLRLLPPSHARSRLTPDGRYVEGPPELVVEVAASSAPIDLGAKKRDYQEAGVLEYLVVLPQEPGIRWFTLENGEYQTLDPDSDGLYRSRVFPGLWLDSEALLRGDARAVRGAVERGLQSLEHQAWLDRLPSAEAP